MRRLLLTTAVCVAAFAAERGVKPRADVSEYPAHRQMDDGAIGAAVLDPQQTRSTFVSDINRGYVVVEIALYPPKGKRIDVSDTDFVLRVAGTKIQARAARPAEIARILQKTAPAERTVDVYPSVGIGYESGPSVYDPNTGTTRRSRGVYTSTGVGVGVGSTRPASTDDDRRTMEQELSDKALPEGEAVSPVCGYLYFPISPKKKASYELEYRGFEKKLVLELR